MKLPTTDSIQELASYWDAHDVTDFDGELLEVPSPFSARDADSVVVPLSASEHVAVRRIAASRGVQEEALLREWVKEKLHRP